MPWIRFTKKNRQDFEVPAGVILMKALLERGFPVASSCGGEGICSKCEIKIIDGARNLSSPNDTEKFLCIKNKIPEDTRISCQATVQGDVIIDTGYW